MSIELVAVSSDIPDGVELSLQFNDSFFKSLVFFWHRVDWIRLTELTWAGTRMVGSYRKVTIDAMMTATTEAAMEAPGSRILARVLK